MFSESKNGPVISSCGIPIMLDEIDKNMKHLCLKGYDGLGKIFCM